MQFLGLGLAEVGDDHGDAQQLLLEKWDAQGALQHRLQRSAPMASLPRDGPTAVCDIVVQVATIRPGPIVGKMMHTYMRRRQKCW